MQSRNAFIGALEMHLGPVRETTYDLSGSLPSSTRPSAVIPMADSPRATEQLISDFNNSNSTDVVGQSKRLVTIDSTPSPRRGSIDGSSVLKRIRQRRDTVTEIAGTSESVSNPQESRAPSWGQVLRRSGQALRDALPAVFGSQSAIEPREREVRYPDLSSLSRRENPMPGAFPDSPQRGAAAIELPQPAGIGLEFSADRPTSGLYFDMRGRGSPLSRSSRTSPLASVSPTRRSHGVLMDNPPASPRFTPLIDHLNRSGTRATRASTSNSSAATDIAVDNDVLLTGSNEQTPIARPRSILSAAAQSPLPSRRPMFVEPTVSDTEEEVEVPTRSVTPSSDQPSRSLPPHDRAHSAPVNMPPDPIPFKPKGIERTLLERFPIIVAHAPKHQALWDRLAVGTLFTVARVACELGVNLDLLDSAKLRDLVGPNEHMGRVEQVLRQAWGEILVDPGKASKALDKDAQGVASELNWEAEQIVKGTGEMLGWKEERGTRYGGKVQFSATLRMDEKAANHKGLDLNHSGRLTLEPPRLRGSSIFSRTFGSHHFLRVRVEKKILREVSPWSESSSRQGARKALQDWSQRPIFILGRVYSPLLEKDSVNIYFLEGPERVGEVFDKGKRAYGITGCTSVRQLIDWWIPFHHNRGQTIQKLVTRLELGISDTLPGILVMPQDIEVADDIKNGENMFTDGAGLMTPSVSKSLLRKYGEPGSYQLHLAYQIRIHTAKGVLLVDPVMMDRHDFSGPHRLKLYRSMCKASRGGVVMRPGPVNGFSILDAACCILCIVKPAPSSSSAGSRLSSQFVTILSHGGVSDEVFLRLQSEALRRELEAWTQIGTERYPDGQKGYRIDENTRLRLARTVARSKGLHQVTKKKELGGMAKGLGYGWNRKADRMDELEADSSEMEESADEGHPGINAVRSHESLESVGTHSGRVRRIVDPWANNEVSGLPAMKSQQLYLALLAGVDIPRSNYWSKIWREMATDVMSSFISGFHITVERSASGFFQPDPTGLLEEGEVCFTVKEAMVDSETGLPVGTILGDVIVGRHPALLPTDMRKVKAVPIPLLQAHRGILFCSVKGERSLASLCAGGDHDGDEGMIIWERAIVSPFRNTALSHLRPPEGFHDRFIDEVKTKTSDVEDELWGLDESEHSLQLSKHLMRSVGEGETFKIYNSFWNKALYRDGYEGYRNERGEAILTAAMMAHTFNALMDSKKTGVQIKPGALAEDKETWSLFMEPYWRQRQLAGDKGFKSFTENLTPLTPRNGRTHILDQLLLRGEADMDRAIQYLQKTLRPMNSTAGELYFDGNGTDVDLAAPWLEAEERARASPDAKASLTRMKDAVQQLQNKFRRLNAESVNKLTTSAQRSLKVLKLCEEFADLRVEGDHLLFDPLGRYTLRHVKASCAYVGDLSRRGGEEHGFAWHVAMRDLCILKATALTDGHTVTVPFSTMEKLDIHRNWG